MNIENMNSAIAIMIRAKEHNSIDMDFWQKKNADKVVTTETELHACGNTACFAGHVAVSPEFKLSGGTACRLNGSPEFDRGRGHEAIQFWLEITEGEAECLVYGALESTDTGESYSHYYNKLWNEVTADDVLVKLYELKQAYENTATQSEDNHA